MRRSLLSKWTISLGVWALPALVFTLPSLREGSTVWRAFLSQGLPWLLWAAFTPFIIDQAKRFPLESGRRGRDLLAHASSALALGVLYGVGTATLYLTFAELPTQSRNALEFYVNSVLVWAPFSLIFYTAIASAGFALAYQQRLRERDLVAAQLETRLVEAQLNGLRMQLQPHFLFNTLNTVSMLVRDGDAQSSVRMLARLSELLRHMLDEGQAQEVPLRTELEYAQRYLEIENFRFGERLRVSIDVPDELRDALVPNLILQPLIENAIRHGITRRASARRVAVGARRSDDRLLLTVSNEGPLLPDGFDVDGQTGIGLRNTQDRLRHLYVPAAELRLENSDALVVASVVIPWHTEPLLMLAR